MKNLYWMEMAAVGLTGTLPDAYFSNTAFGGQMQHFDLNNNALTGARLPCWWCLSLAQCPGVQSCLEIASAQGQDLAVCTACSWPTMSAPRTPVQALGGWHVLAARLATPAQLPCRARS